MRFALTGVPGVGKTTIAGRVAQRHAARVVHLNAFAEAQGLLGEEDPERGARLVDVDALAHELNEALEEAHGHVLVEGHFAHEMDVDHVILLRLDPAALIPRLEARGWRAEKVRENVEAEALDVLAGEVLETGLPATELDVTGLAVEDAAAAVWEIVEGRPDALKGRAVGTAAWSLEALPWFSNDTG